jgi:hypothetical protein
MTQFFINKYLHQFNSFIKDLKKLFVNKSINDNDNNSDNDNINDIIIEYELNLIEELSDNEKIERGMLFNNLLSDELFNLFIKSKIKIFSHKSENTKDLAQSLFGNKLTLKNLLNNQSNDIKNIIWKNLHNLYIIIEFMKPYENQNAERISIINKQLNIDINKLNFNKDDIKTKLTDILNIDINDTTYELIDDIINSFDNVLSNNSNTNILSGIMETSQNISKKYVEQIEKGDIQLDKILENIFNKIPGIDKIMPSFINNNTNPNEDKIIIDNNFSTANIDSLKIENKDSNTNLKFGNILKMADKLGVLSNSLNNDNDNDNESNNDNLNDNMSNIFNNLFNGISKNKNIPEFNNINKMINIIKKIDNLDSQDDMNTIKNEMENFLQSDMGINLSQLNEKFNLTESKET